MSRVVKPVVKLRKQFAATNTQGNSATNKRPPKTADMLKAARLFYKDGLTQGKIAAELGTYAKRVRLMLREAKRLGLVRIEICDPRTDALVALEEKIGAEFGHLVKVKVVPGGEIETEKEYSELLRRWASEAATYFDTLVDDGKKHNVGFSGGETLLEVANALPVRDRDKVTFHATAFIGRGRLEKSSHVEPTTVVNVAWARSGRLPGHCQYATVPPYDHVGSRFDILREVNSLGTRKPIAEVIKELNQLDIAFASLGLVNPGNTSLAHNRLSMFGLLQASGITPKELTNEGAVGDLSYCLFDDAGQENPVDKEKEVKLSKSKWRLFLTAGHHDPQSQGVEFYRQMVEKGGKVIVIAGTYKVRAIQAALKNQLFNVLITDEQSAKQLVAMK